MIRYFPFYAGNLLYKHCWWLYKPLYIIYKKLSECKELELLEKATKPGATVVDIGANIGFYTCILSQLCGSDGFVHAFEPDLLNFKRLQECLAKKTNIRLNQSAISNQCGTITLYRSSILNVDHRTYKVDDRTETATIPSLTLDFYLNGDQVDVIKMDIQGYEYQALLGMKQTLKSAKSLFILMELWPYGLQLAKSSTLQVEQILKESGFSLFLITKQGLKQFNSSNIGCNQYRYYSLVACKGDVLEILS